MGEFKVAAGDQCVRLSTKCEDVNEAEEAASNLYWEANYKAKKGELIVTRNFKSIAGAVKAVLQKRIEAGQAKVIYKDYIAVIDNYLIPFFGNYNVNTIDYGILQKFNRHRTEKLKREPSKSTIATHTSALNRVFEEAVAQGYMTQAQVPHIKTNSNGKTTKRRPDFTIDEYRQLYRFMRKWVKQGKKGKSTEMRYLLRDYVLFLANSGIRHGTEGYNLKWNHIGIRKDNKTGINYVYLKVNGKTGSREALPRANAKRYLRRIQLRTHALKDLSFEDAIKTDEYVFALPDGTRTKNLHQTFRKLMNDSKLLMSVDDQPRTLYSLRHFYITQAIINNRASLHTIAKQCGTSILMLEKHYSHITVHHMHQELLK